MGLPTSELLTQHMKGQPCPQPSSPFPCCPPNLVLPAGSFTSLSSALSTQDVWLLILHLMILTVRPTAAHQFSCLGLWACGPVGLWLANILLWDSPPHAVWHHLLLITALALLPQSLHLFLSSTQSMALRSCPPPSAQVAPMPLPNSS